MFLKDILASKGSDVYAIAPGATLAEVVAAFLQRRIGSLVVCETCADRANPMIAIITERDVLRTLARRRVSLSALRVVDAMSPNLVTALPHTPLEEAMRLMTRHRVRHLPVVESGGRLCGIVSIGDVVKAHHDQLEMENFFMSSYIQGEGAEIGTTLC